MRQVRMLSLDLDGTIVTHRFDVKVWRTVLPSAYAKDRGIGLARARRETYAEYERLRGIREWTDLSFWISHFRLDTTEKALLREAAPALSSYADAAVLDRLRKRVPLVLVTQSTRAFIAAKLGRRQRLFSHILSVPDDFSRLRKDEEVFVRVAGRIGVPAASLLHVGDHLDFDYRLPKRAGWQAMLLNRSGRKGIPEIRQVTTLRRLLKLFP